MVRFFRGCKPSPAHKTGLGAMSLPDAASVPMPPVVDQGMASSCVGNACAVAVQAAAGQPFGERPSRRYVYALARARGGDSPLIDQGAQIAEAFGAMAEAGYPGESSMPYSDDPIEINEMPKVEALREAIDQAPVMVTGAYRISSTGARRVRDVAAAIAAGHCVVWGTELDEPFEDMAPGDVWPGVTRAGIGGHAMVIFQYRTNAAGRAEFRTRSSWGSGWCEDGSAWVSEGAVASPNASDFWIVAVARKLSES